MASARHAPAMGRTTPPPRCGGTTVSRTAWRSTISARCRSKAQSISWRRAPEGPPNGMSERMHRLRTRSMASCWRLAARASRTTLGSSARTYSRSGMWGRAPGGMCSKAAREFTAAMSSGQDSRNAHRSRAHSTFSSDMRSRREGARLPSYPRHRGSNQRSTWSAELGTMPRARTGRCAPEARRHRAKAKGTRVMLSVQKPDGGTSTGNGAGSRAGGPPGQARCSNTHGGVRTRGGG